MNDLAKIKKLGILSFASGILLFIISLSLSFYRICAMGPSSDTLCEFVYSKQGDFTTQTTHWLGIAALIVGTILLLKNESALIQNKTTGAKAIHYVGFLLMLAISLFIAIFGFFLLLSIIFEAI